MASPNLLERQRFNVKTQKLIISEKYMFNIFSIGNQLKIVSVSPFCIENGNNYLHSLNPTNLIKTINNVTCIEIK